MGSPWCSEKAVRPALLSRFLRVLTPPPPKSVSWAAVDFAATAAGDTNRASELMLILLGWLAASSLLTGLGGVIRLAAP